MIIKNVIFIALIQIYKYPKVFLLLRLPKGAAVPMKQSFGKVDLDQPRPSL